MPYSATRISTCDEFLPDGTEVKGKSTTFEWRDAEGRTRYEEFEKLPVGTKRRIVTITDPVSHEWWSFDIGKGVDKAAFHAKYKFPFKETILYPTTYTTLPGGTTNRSIIAHYAHPEGPGYREEVPTPTYINGVWAEGDRLIHLVPPVMPSKKNSHDDLDVTESWFSVDLGEEVRWKETRWKTDDPTPGAYRRESTDRSELVKIDRSDPDPALFRPPADYRILESKPQSESKTEQNPQ
ncbi:MAG: hypothetical protein KGL37_10850 [Acidobacteriota bacterium]|nr:hypothetical protein [Acidobacteriota bacterium]